MIHTEDDLTSRHSTFFPESDSAHLVLTQSFFYTVLVILLLYPERQVSGPPQFNLSVCALVVGSIDSGPYRVCPLRVGFGVGPVPTFPKFVNPFPLLGNWGGSGVKFS